jgi:hypothetical protein
VLRAPLVRIELLGGFRLGGAPGQLRLPASRHQELVAFLILFARHGPVTRQRVAGSLWPDSPDAQALTNLRRELHHLREDWPTLHAMIDVSTRALAWSDRADVTVDLCDFESAAGSAPADDRAALRRAAACYRGDLLPACDAGWMAGERDRLRERAQQVFGRLADLLERDGAFSEAVEYANRLLRLDPLDERPAVRDSVELTDHSKKFAIGGDGLVAGLRSKSGPPSPTECRDPSRLALHGLDTSARYFSSGQPAPSCHNPGLPRIQPQVVGRRPRRIR